MSVKLVLRIIKKCTLFYTLWDSDVTSLPLALCAPILQISRRSTRFAHPQSEDLGHNVHILTY